MDSVLRRNPSCSTEPEEEEDEEYETPMACAHCDDPIDTGMEIFLLQLVYPYFDRDTNLQMMVMIGDSGEPAMEPVFFDFTCFEDRAEELGELVKSGDILTFDEPHSVLHCDYCQSSIRIGEKCLSIESGELQLSERAPDTPKFENTDNMLWTMCLSCALHLLVYDFGADEPNDVLSQNGECRTCTQHRCWRIGRCACRCHRR